jgi:ABC-type polysaccharide/polyol phosphate export permease
MIVMTVVFQWFFARGIPNFPVYLLSGQIVFTLFSEITNASLTSIAAGSGLIGKVYVPKYIFPLSKSLSALVNIPFSLAALVVVFIFTRQKIYWTVILIPIPIIYTFLFALGVGLILSSLNVMFRDLLYLWGVALTLLQFLTPVFWDISLMPEIMQTVIGFNPIYHFVDYFRQLVMYGAVPGLWSNMVCCIFVAIALVSGLYVFITKQDEFILYL